METGGSPNLDRTSLAAVVVSLLFGTAAAWAGSQGGAYIGGIPLFALLVAIAFLIQWLAFLPAYLGQTEKYFDITGSMTYATVTLFAVLLSPVVDGRAILLLLLVLIWATRLGFFLLRRVHQAGKDARFDTIKTSFGRFLMTWTLQGLWVTLTVGPALAAITSVARRDLGPLAAIGAAVWACGFGIEAVADAQKSRFRANPDNAGRFIDSGLWAWSRHPNYLGEIVLWVGIALIAAPVLRGWQWATMISPIFVALLLTRVSGIPMLEERADERWGGQEDYEAYKSRTPVLFPRILSRGDR